MPMPITRKQYASLVKRLESFEDDLATLNTEVEIMTSLEVLFSSKKPFPFDLVDVATGEYYPFWEYLLAHPDSEMALRCVVKRVRKDLKGIGKIEAPLDLFAHVLRSESILGMTNLSSFIWLYETIIRYGGVTVVCDSLAWDGYEDLPFLVDIFSKEEEEYLAAFLLLRNLEVGDHAIKKEKEQRALLANPPSYSNVYYRLSSELTTDGIVEISNFFKLTRCSTCALKTILGKPEKVLETIERCEKCTTCEKILDCVVEHCYTHPAETDTFTSKLVEDLQEITAPLKTLKIVETKDPTVPPIDDKSAIATREHLLQYVQGQDKVVSEISVLSAAYCNNLYAAGRGNSNHAPHAVSMLLGGNTGTGKTYIAETLGKYLDIPVISIDVTTLTPAGYKGADLDTICSDAKSSIARFYKDKEPIGFVPYILFFDEVDKLLAPNEDTAAFYQSVQTGMLKCLEKGVTYADPTSDKYGYPMIVLAGSFMFSRNKNVAVKPIGFGAHKVVEAAKLERTNLLQFGLLPELVGRISVISETNDLTVNDYVQLLLHKKNSAMDKALHLGAAIGKTLAADEKEALVLAAAKYAATEKVGVRGLEGFLMQKILFS